MVRLIVFSALVAMACAAPFQPELDQHWKAYKLTFKKVYPENEESARRLIWEQNLARIIRHNIEADLGKHSFTMGLNHLSDMTVQEVRQTLNGYKGSKKTSKAVCAFVPPFNARYPAEVDWRKDGLVTDVKNQGQCGSCWAFSTTGSLEGQNKKKTGQLVSLSEQNLVDCSGQQGNEGCEGGLMDNAFEYIKENRGVDTEAAYPYEAVDGNCRFKSGSVGATVTGYVDIPQGDEEALQKAVATVGPISVAIDASNPSFQGYSRGIYNEPDCSTTELDHGVLVVGYGSSDGEDYWLVKNSWGSSWGENGYIRMSRNKRNQCGIATEASYPLV